jgi:pyridoxine kinase
MAHVIVLSSWVTHGHVGLSAAAPVLQALGHTVTGLPTVQLSNHAGWPHVAGRRVDVTLLSEWVEALDANGWLSQPDAILTGYLPSAGHVAFATALIDRVRASAPALRCIVDPVLGDMPKGLYIPVDAAEAIREKLLHKADVLTPNLFELSWLSGRDIGDLAAALDAAQTLAARAEGARILVTSPPVGPGQTGVLEVSPAGARQYRTPLVPREAPVPNGVGDVFSALIAGGVAVGQALGHLQALIDQSLGAPHLRIAETAPVWSGAKAIAPDGTAPLTGGGETR